MAGSAAWPAWSNTLCLSRWGASIAATTASPTWRCGRTAFTTIIEAARERYGAHRIGVVVGTSTSGVAQAEGAWLRLDSEGRLPDGFNFEATQDLGSLAAFLRQALGCVAQPA